MKKVIKVDEQGFFLEDCIVKDDIAERNLIEVPCPNGFYKPKWNGNEWVEGASEEYINIIKNQPHKPMLEEMNRADIDYLSIMTGVDL